ncbi:MAG TPA: translation initiation factor IF-3 [bacterium]|nr:translation initiation factor IF-3 [bacterium]HQG45428.1 translation initiation factor IF-3 [bacterium]HQI48868.1 translation initiation factor IF-3 [bacterium]HQJ64753.1 translation initiation factor IF-3 [bacterium]
MKKKLTRVNELIDAPSVRLVDEKGEQVGIVSRNEALRRAESAGLDLVEVSPNAAPPVCKIMDFGKFKYELSKKEKETRKKQHVIVTKEIRMRPKIEEHDFEFKLKHARKFLLEGDRVRASVQFKGREMIHQEFGRKIMERFIENLQDVAKTEKDPTMEGGQLVVFFVKK